MERLSKYNDYDIIILAMFRWDGPYSSISIALAKEFAKNNRVFYINHPYTYKDYYQILKDEGKEERLAQLKAGKVVYEQDEKLSDRFISVYLPPTIPINFLPKGILYNTFFKINNSKVHKGLNQVIEDHKVEDYIYINCFDPYYAPTLKTKKTPLLNIYQSVDDITQEAYIARHGLRLERKAVSAADLTLVTSHELYRLNKDYTDHIEILNNAADISNFRKALEHTYVRPAELKDYPEKIIGYFGNLDSVRIDYPLLKAIAEYHKDKTLLLIGPLNNEAYKSIGLDQLPNVIFTGPKHISELPAYLHHFDVAIIPFLCNTLTKSIYPLKINEYLSAGKPVVSTPFSEDIIGFESSIYLSQENDNHVFLQLIDQAIKEDTAEKIQSRVDVANTNTWSARVEQFWNFVDKRLEVAPQLADKN